MLINYKRIKQKTHQAINRLVVNLIKIMIIIVIIILVIKIV